MWGFTAFILLAKKNNTGTLTEGVAFASLSLFELLNHPMTTIINGFENLQTVLNCFGRIQDYLNSQERVDYRIPLHDRKDSSVSGFSTPDDTLKDTIILKEKQDPDSGTDAFVAVVEGASVGYTIGGDSPTLKNLNFQIPRGEITMVFGAVGSGKSTLLKLLLGEMPSVSGLIRTGFSLAAYCPQSPWVTWGTVQSNIVGMSEWDKKWYDTVVSACALRTDLEELPNGDQTHIGTQGSRLSGGQKMRVVSGG